MFCDAWRRAATLGALAGLLALAGVANAQENEGRLIEIGPDNGAEAASEEPPRRFRRDRQRRLSRPGFVDPIPGRQEAVPIGRYWIGIAAEPTPPELLAHLDLRDTTGLLVREVVPEGPAAEAGIEPLDILIHANNKPLSSLVELADLVGDAGQNKARITVELMRNGQPRTVFVAPAWKEIPPPIAPRPAQAPGGVARGRLRQWLGERLADEGLFGPGGIDQLLQERIGQLEAVEPGLAAPFDGAPGLDGGEAPAFVPQALPGGVSVNITRQGAGPAQVTVRRAGVDGQADEWRFDADDQEALDQLPADVRPTVERMLGGMAMGPAGAGGIGGPLGVPVDGDLQERMQQMEQQLDRFRRQFPNRAPNGAFRGGPLPGDPLQNAPRLFNAPAEAELVEPLEEGEVVEPEEGPTELIVPAE